MFRALVDEFPGAGGAALDWRACVRAFGLEHDSAASERLVALLGGAAPAADVVARLLARPLTAETPLG